MTHAKLSALVLGFLALWGGQAGAQDSVGGPAGTYLVGTSGVSMLIHKWMGSVHVDVRSYGAVGDGMADDTAAVQGAVNFVASRGGGTVFLPPGTYLVTSAVTIVQDGTSIVGSGEAVTRLVAGAINLGPIVVNIPASTTARMNATISGISITSIAVNTSTAISVTGGAVLVDGVACLGSYRRCLYLASSTGSGTRSVVRDSTFSTVSGDSLGVGIEAALGNLMVVDSLVSGYATAIRSSAAQYGLFVSNSRITGVAMGIDYSGQDYFTVTGSYVGAPVSVSVGHLVAGFAQAGNVLTGSIVDLR